MIERSDERYQSVRPDVERIFELQFSERILPDLPDSERRAFIELCTESFMDELHQTGAPRSVVVSPRFIGRVRAHVLASRYSSVQKMAILTAFDAFLQSSFKDAPAPQAISKRTLMAGGAVLAGTALGFALADRLYKMRQKPHLRHGERIMQRMRERTKERPTFAISTDAETLIDLWSTERVLRFNGSDRSDLLLHLKPPGASGLTMSISFLGERQVIMQATDLKMLIIHVRSHIDVDTGQEKPRVTMELRLVEKEGRAIGVDVSVRPMTPADVEPSPKKAGERPSP